MQNVDEILSQLCNIAFSLYKQYNGLARDGVRPFFVF